MKKKDQSQKTTLVDVEIYRSWIALLMIVFLVLCLVAPVCSLLLGLCVRLYHFAAGK